MKTIKLAELLDRGANPSVCKIAEYGYQNCKILYGKVLNKILSLYDKFIDWVCGEKD